MPNQNSPAKPSSDFVNGMVIGGSLIVLIIGLLVWSSLNSIYWTQRNALIMSGIDTSQVDFISLDLAFDISFCATAVAYSSYLFIYTSARRINPTIRSLTEFRGRKFNWANRLLAGGALFVAFSTSDVVLTFYSSSYTNPTLGVVLELSVLHL